MLPAVLTRYFKGTGLSFRRRFGALDPGWSEALPSDLEKENFNLKWSWTSEISRLFSSMLSITWCPLEENLFWKPYPYLHQAGQGCCSCFWGSLKSYDTRSKDVFAAICPNATISHLGLAAVGVVLSHKKWMQTCYTITFKKVLYNITILCFPAFSS